MKVESNLPHRQHSVVASQACQLTAHRVVHLAGIVGMNADRSTHILAYGGKRDGCSRLGKRLSNPDHHEVLNASLSGSIEDGIRSLGKIFRVQVTVGVNQHGGTLARSLNDDA